MSGKHPHRNTIMTSINMSQLWFFFSDFLISCKNHPLKNVPITKDLTLTLILEQTFEACYSLEERSGSFPADCTALLCRSGALISSSKSVTKVGATHLSCSIQKQDFLFIYVLSSFFLIVVQAVVEDETFDPRATLWTCLD